MHIGALRELEHAHVSSDSVPSRIALVASREIHHGEVPRRIAPWPVRQPVLHFLGNKKAAGSRQAARRGSEPLSRPFWPIVEISIGAVDNAASVCARSDTVSIKSVSI